MNGNDFLNSNEKIIRINVNPLKRLLEWEITVLFGSNFTINFQAHSKTDGQFLTDFLYIPFPVRELTWYSLYIAVRGEKMTCEIEDDEAVDVKAEKRLKIFDFVSKLQEPDRIEIGRSLVGCISNISFDGERLDPQDNSTTSLIKKSNGIRGRESH